MRTDLTEQHERGLISDDYYNRCKAKAQELGNPEEILGRMESLAEIEMHIDHELEEQRVAELYA